MVPVPWFSKVAENGVYANVLAERGVVCISKEQLDHHFLWDKQKAAFQRIVFLTYSYHVLNVLNGARTLVFKGS